MQIHVGVISIWHKENLQRSPTLDAMQKMCIRAYFLDMQKRGAQGLMELLGFLHIIFIFWFHREVHNSL
jgi:tRNA (Thr-GGU) A37 N-methylase